MAKRRRISGGLKRQHEFMKALNFYQNRNPQHTLHGVASMIGVPSSTLYRWKSGAGLPANGPTYRRAMAGLDALIAGNPVPKDDTARRNDLLNDVDRLRAEGWGSAPPEPPGRDEIKRAIERTVRAGMVEAYAPPPDTAPIGWIVGISLAIGAVLGGAVVALAKISGVLPL